MRKTAIITILFAIGLASLPAFAQATQVKGTFTEITGKVEIQLAGQAAWKPVKVGTVIEKATTISTGFKSTCVIQIGNALVTLKPLSRLRLDNMVADMAKGITETAIFLVTGKVSAEVAPTQNVVTTFQVMSPTATASVRGTGFEFDGINLRVYHGLVAIASPTGVVRTVGAGESSSVSDPATVEVPTFVGEVEGVVLTESSIVFDFTVLPGEAPYIPPTEGTIILILE
jgi:hypothetical protein